MREVLGIAAAFALTAGGALAAAVPVPDARELPRTAASYPYLAADRQWVPFDLKAAGYEEVETLVSGKANVYDWGADGRPEIKGGGAYATRILVRRPADRSKFSGVVLVEPLLDARSSDWAMMWGYMHEKLVRDGDVWIGVTLPKSIGALKKFDPARYEALSFAPPAPLGCKTGEAGDLLEEGLRYEMLAQVGALLKSASPANPLAGYRADRRLFMTAQALDPVTYARAFQTLLRLPDGGPVYDGFLFKTQNGAMARLSHCGQPVPATDPRAALKNIGVPAIAVISPGEVLGSLPSRRPDSDDKADPYRRVEVPGGNHLDHFAYAGGFPAAADQVKAGVAQGNLEWPFNTQCTPSIQLGRNPLMKYVYDAALEQLAAWSRTGLAPPRAPWISVKPGAAGAQTVELDANGIAIGGLRTVYSDLPVATETIGTAGPGNCREIGSTVAFSWPYLTRLYGTPRAWAAKARTRVDAMEKGRWLTPGDAALLRAEIAAPARPPAFPAN